MKTVRDATTAPTAAGPAAITVPDASSSKLRMPSSSKGKNIMAMKRIYQTDEEEEFRDEENFRGHLHGLKKLIRNRSKVMKTDTDSSFEILSGSFSKIRPKILSDSIHKIKPIAETSKGRAHSTPKHPMEFISGNTSVRTNAAPSTSKNCLNIKKSTEKIHDFVGSLCSNEIKEMESGLDESEYLFASIGDRVKELFEEIDAVNVQRLEALEENAACLETAIAKMSETLARRRRSIAHIRENRVMYKDFLNNLVERMPSKFHFLLI